jgi:hypothetical protein
MFRQVVLRAAGASGSKSARKPRFDSDTLDTLLLKDEEPQLGAQIISRRHRYSHHGIYVGGGRVVHYAGFAYGLSSGPIECLSFPGRALVVIVLALAALMHPLSRLEMREPAEPDSYG